VLAGLQNKIGREKCSETRRESVHILSVCAVPEPWQEKSVVALNSTHKSFSKRLENFNIHSNSRGMPRIKKLHVSQAT